MSDDFLDENPSAEDQSRRILELLHKEGMKVPQGKDRERLDRFTSEHNRQEQRAAGLRAEYVSWGHMGRGKSRLISFFGLGMYQG